MNTYLLKLTALLAAIFAATTLARATPSGGISIARLHPAFGDKERVSSFQLSPDEATVVFYAGDFSKNSYTLQAAPRRAGSPPITISRPEDTGRIAQYAITPDSQTVIYHNHAALIAAALDGSDAHTISLPLSQTSDLVKESISRFWFVPDQQSIVYEISTYPLVYERLVRINLDGGAGAELVLNRSGLDVEGLTAERIIYRAAVGADNVRLFALPITGGAPVALTPGLDSAAYVTQDVQISPDEQTAVFKVGSTINQEMTGLYEAALDGSRTVRLSDPAHTRLCYVLISPDSQSIVYGNQATFEIGGVDAADLYRVVRGGGPATKLNGAAQPSTFYFPQALAITPDSQRVVFTGKNWAAGGDYQILSVPIAGGAPITLSEPGTYFAFVIAQHGQNVVYTRADADATRNRLYRVSINGGPSTLLSGFLGDEGRLDMLQAPGGGHTLVAIQRGDASHTAYSFDLRYGTARVLNPAPFSGLFFSSEQTLTVTKSGDVISLAEVVGSAAQEELFVTIREDADQTVRLFVPLLQR